MLTFPRPDRGVLFVVSGPSGVGKSTLVEGARGRIPGLAFSVSATTRAARPGEVDGVHYHFVDQAVFDARVMAQEFLEHASVYGRSYGTLRGPVEAALAQGDSLILDIDVQGSRQVRKRLPEAVHIIVVPPSVSSLEERLRNRGERGEIIADRMRQVATQLGAVDEYDYVVVNDNIEAANATFQGILLAELSRLSRRTSLVQEIRRQLPG